MSVTRARTCIVKDDLMHFTAYKKQRKEFMRQGIDLTRKRRLFIGPYASLMFRFAQSGNRGSRRHAYAECFSFFL
jgi:hypothetical protein